MLLAKTMREPLTSSSSIVGEKEDENLPFLHSQIEPVAFDVESTNMATKIPKSSKSAFLIMWILYDILSILICIGMSKSFVMK